jgi:hypothetical protein
MGVDNATSSEPCKLAILFIGKTLRGFAQIVIVVHTPLADVKNL